jgi:CheY-like chemotaxis protein/anti-sigma regulatory factor (Ser/Thr protein kinase)
MSHELRTPLNAIIGYGELLQEEAQDKGDDQLASDSRKIHIAGKHLLALINDVLDLSKIEAGRMELFLEDIDVPSMITDVVSTVEPLVQKRDNVLDVRCSPQVGSVHGDLIKTRQCLFNLLSNAAKFTEKGTVTLDASRCGDRIVFTVKDTGIGMTEDQMGRLFQSFSQGDSTIGSRFGGSGLGLAMMGGDINVASIPGEGSTFTLRLPAGAGADMPGREPEGEAVPSGEAGATVLVIDDDPAVRDLLKRTLTREGFRVECASGGEEGLTCARELHPDVITLDVLMPGADGWAVLAALKNDGATANIPVIMLSITDNKERGCTLGAAEYLYKPVDKETLIKAVRKYGGGGPMSVLIVEDDQTTRKLLRVTLEKEGWSVLEAEDGIAGLRRLEEIRPELILTDLMMPKMDGFEFVAELRRNESWKDIPVMVLTAKDLAAEERRQLEMSVGSVLQKGSYRREELLTEVRSLVTECVHKRR